MIIYLSEATIYYKINSTLQRVMHGPNSIPIPGNLLKISPHLPDLLNGNLDFISIHSDSNEQ